MEYFKTMIAEAEKDALEGLFEEQNLPKRKIRYGRWVVIFGTIFAVSFYVYSLLYGNYSQKVLSHLREKQAVLEKKVQALQTENVQLQKIVFELKGLEPKSEERK